MKPSFDDALTCY